MVSPYQLLFEFNAFFKQRQLDLVVIIAERKSALLKHLISLKLVVGSMPCTRGAMVMPRAIVTAVRNGHNPRLAFQACALRYMIL